MRRSIPNQHRKSEGSHLPRTVSGLFLVAPVSSDSVQCVDWCRYPSLKESAWGGAYRIARTLFPALVLVLLLAVDTSTQSAKESPSPQVDLERMLKEWQSRLELSAWKIEVHVVPPDSLGTDKDGDVTVADINYDGNTSSAIIRVEQASHEKIEEYLIHELTHLRLACWRPPAQSAAEEGTVDAITHALLCSKNQQ
jgi:hypothetical protein